MLEKIDRGLARVEAVAVVGVLAVMVTLAAVNLMLHKVFDSGFEWADIIVRQMVLWLGFLGGALATYEGRHIAIDAVGKFMKPKVAAIARVVTSLTAMGLSAVMLSASVDFIRAEIEDGSMVFGDVPAWPFEAIMPVAFVFICFHFFVAAYRNVLVFQGKRPPPTEFAEMDLPEEAGEETGGDA